MRPAGLPVRQPSDDLLVHRIERVPAHAIWEITSACNLRCIHCEGSAGRRDPAELTPTEALALCNALADAGCRQCNVSGGEPLLRPDWDALCARLGAKGVNVCLITNGTRVDAEVLRRMRDAGVTRVALSIDGTKCTHDRVRPSARAGTSNFEGVLGAIDCLGTEGLRISVITHFNRWNLHELEEIHRLLGARGVHEWQVQLGLPIGRFRQIDEPYMIAPEDLEGLASRLARVIESEQPPRVRVTDTIGYYTEYEPVLRRTSAGEPRFWTGCHAGILCVSVESNGDVKGCASMPRDFVAGNVRERPFGDIWADRERFAYNTEWREDKLTGYCARCAYRRLCRAGCTTLAFSVTGTAYDNPYCLHRVREVRREAGGQGMP